MADEETALNFYVGETQLLSLTISEAIDESQLPVFNYREYYCASKENKHRYKQIYRRIVAQSRGTV